MKIQIPVSPGELLDKLSVLEIKAVRISDAQSLKNIRYELDLLSQVRERDIPRTEELDRRYLALKKLNETLWDIENKIRTCERNHDFNKSFITLAQSVYHTNDERAKIKKQINTLLGSSITEEKSYTPY